MALTLFFAAFHILIQVDLVTEVSSQLEWTGLHEAGLRWNPPYGTGLDQTDWEGLKRTGVDWMECHKFGVDWTELV